MCYQIVFNSPLRHSVSLSCFPNNVNLDGSIYGHRHHAKVANTKTSTLGHNQRSHGAYIRSLTMTYVTHTIRKPVLTKIKTSS